LQTFFSLLNFMAENFIFSYIGMSFFTYRCHNFNAKFICWSIFTIVVARAVMIYPLSYLINLFKSRSKKGIPIAYQHCLVFAGLRGAIAFALAMRGATGGSDGRRMILSTTLVIVLVTVLVFGGGTMSVLQKLKIRVGVRDDEEMDTRASRGGVPVPQPENHDQKSCLARNWQGFDRNYMRPVLGAKYSPGTESLPAVIRTVKQYVSLSTRGCAPVFLRAELLRLLHPLCS
jgi:sodium/hydrogen exchanger-like protein 6/7